MSGWWLVRLTIGSLFSGIGGLELGLEWAGFGPVLWQVEKSEFCRRKLAWRYPDAQRFEDVRAVGAANLAPVDLVCGGFPCQDVSAAGKRAGLDGARSGLWFEFARVVGELRPRWVVVENVTSGASKWVGPVRAGLEQLGYASLPVPLQAADCGAPHERARVFIVAHRWLSASDGDVAQQPTAEGAPSDAHSVDLREQPGGRTGRAQTLQSAQPRAHADDNACLIHGVRDQGREEARHDAPRHGGWATEPALARVVHGLPGRVDYECALGNSVVPQCAEVVGHVIRQLMGAA